MTTTRWIATAAAAALALAVTAAVLLPAVLAVLRGERPLASEASVRAQGFFHSSTPEDAIRHALALDDADLRWAIQRAGLGGRVDPGNVRSGLRARARRDVSCSIPRPGAPGAAGAVRRWQAKERGWDLWIDVTLPPGLDRKAAESLAKRARTRVALRTLRWLRERAPRADCMERPIAWLWEDLDERERAAEVLACLRAFRTSEAKVYFLGAAATQAGLWIREEAEWAGAWRKPPDPAWLAEQERAVARLAWE